MALHRDGLVLAGYLLFLLPDSLHKFYIFQPFLPAQRIGQLTHGFA